MAKVGRRTTTRESLAADPRVVVDLEGGGVIVRGVVEDLGASPRFPSVVSLSRQIHRKFHWLDVAQNGRSPGGNEAAPNGLICAQRHAYARGRESQIIVRCALDAGLINPIPLPRDGGHRAVNAA